MTAPEIAVAHLGADYFADPYSVHARLRAQRPVTPVVLPGGPGTWLITGYAEARAALTDPRLSKHMPGWHPDPDSIVAALDLHMLNSDPPDHTRLRKLVNKAFTARRVERLRPRITAITEGLLEDMTAERGRAGIKTQLKQIESDASTLVSSAKSDFPSETSAITSSVNTLKSSVTALPSSPSAAQIATVGKDAAGVVSSVRSFVDASDSKCS